MGIFDAWIVYQFIKVLAMPWDEMDAFKLGIVDANGKQLKKTSQLKTQAEKNAYTIFHRLIFNVKRLLEKMPFGKTKMATYATALYLIKEQMSEPHGAIILEKGFFTYMKDHDALPKNYLKEQYLEERIINQGQYKLLTNAIDGDGEFVPKGTILEAPEDTEASSRILGIEVFKLYVEGSSNIVAVSYEDILRVT